MKKKLQALALLASQHKGRIVGGVIAGSIGLAHADTTPDTTAIVAAGASIAAIGAAVFGNNVAVRLWGWLKAALGR